MVPSLVERQTAVRRPVASSPQSTKTRPPQTIGEPCPDPGSSTFHKRFAASHIRGHFTVREARAIRSAEARPFSRLSGDCAKRGEDEGDEAAEIRSRLVIQWMSG